MATKILTSNPISIEKGLAIVRIVTGLLMVYHGLEIFNRELMEGYINWDKMMGLPAPEVMVYVGKGVELVTGILLTLGLATRLATLLIMIDMLFICFFVGSGKIYGEDQHPFLFVLLAFLFFMTGPGTWSIQSRK